MSVALEIARPAAVSNHPNKSALDVLAFGENDEVMQLVTFDNLQVQVPIFASAATTVDTW